jgi:succinate dehydrogenase / fumarate reductase, cytochrome b subunit
MSSLKTTLNGYVTYRGREGQLSFLLHRISGLGTLLFLAIHILDTSTVYFFPNDYAKAIDLYRTTIAGLGEMVLVAAVLFHGANGLRIALFDWKPDLWHKVTERRSVIFTILLAFILWLPVAFLMGRNILINNYGFGG